MSQHHRHSSELRKKPKTYQLAIETARVAVELVIETATPQRSVSCATVGTLGLDAAWGRVAVAVWDQRNVSRRIGCGGEAKVAVW